MGRNGGMHVVGGFEVEVEKPLGAGNSQLAARFGDRLPRPVALGHVVGGGAVARPQDLLDLPEGVASTAYPHRGYRRRGVSVRSGARTPASSTRSRRSCTSLLPYTRQGESVTSGGRPGSGCSIVPSRRPVQRARPRLPSCFRSPRPRPDGPLRGAPRSPAAACSPGRRRRCGCRRRPGARTRPGACARALSRSPGNGRGRGPRRGCRRAPAGRRGRRRRGPGPTVAAGEWRERPPAWPGGCGPGPRGRSRAGSRGRRDSARPPRRPRARRPRR